MARITENVLRAKVDIVNGILGHNVPQDGPAAGYSVDDGSFRLSCAYGGYAVHRAHGPHGGVQSLTAHESARSCSDFLDGMIAGLRYGAGA